MMSEAAERTKALIRKWLPKEEYGDLAEEFIRECVDEETGELVIERLEFSEDENGNPIPARKKDRTP